MVGIQLSTYKINAVRKRVMYMEYVWIHLYIQNIDITYIDIQKKRHSYKNFDSKITTFLLKLLAISFFAYEQSHTYIKITWFQTHLTKERSFQFTILFFVWNRKQTLNFWCVENIDEEVFLFSFWMCALACFFEEKNWGRELSFKLIVTTTALTYIHNLSLVKVLLLTVFNHPWWEILCSLL